MGIANTVAFAPVKAHQNAENAAHDEEQSQEIKVSYVFPKRSAFVRVEIQAEEQDAHGKTRCWSAAFINMCEGTIEDQCRTG